MSKTKVFISVSAKEKKLGQIVVDKLARLFGNRLEFSLFAIPIGSEWKYELKKNLETSDILISILTPYYLQRPWAYIEWAPFWLSEKRTFLMVPSRNNRSDTHLDVFNDIQFAFFDDESTLESLVSEIATLSGVDYQGDYPLICDFKVLLCNEYNRISEEIKVTKFDNYKINNILPFSDTEKEDYALYFYEKNDNQTFFEILKSISSEEVKFEIARIVLDRCDINVFKQLISYIYTGDRLHSLLVYVVYTKGNRDLNYREVILDQMVAMGDNCMIQFLLYMIKNGIDKDGLFEIVLNKLEMDMSRRIVYFALWEKGEKYRAEGVYHNIVGNPEKVIISSRHAQNKEFEVFKNRIAFIINDNENIRLIVRMIEKFHLKYNEFKDYYDSIVKNMRSDPELRRLYKNYNYDFLYQVINDRLSELGYPQFEQ